MTQSDFGRAFEEHNNSSTYLLWVNQRKETLKRSVAAHDVLRYFGINLKIGGSDHEEQICCPFHGDSSPSARVYGEQGDSPSAVYCYVCRKRWDIFGLWKEFNHDSEMRFTAVLLGLERAFGIMTPEAPSMSFKGPQGPTDEEKVVLDKLQVCERRIAQNRKNLAPKVFFTLGKLLDTLHYQVKNELIGTEQAAKNIQMILDKIAEKARES